MEKIFYKNKIIEFENNKKTFELWKKYVIDEVNNEKKKKINKKIKSIKNFDKYLHEWKELRNTIDDSEKEKTEYIDSNLTECENSYFIKNEINLKKKKELLKENYINEYEKYIEKLNNDIENYFVDNKKELCVISYENYLDRNVNIGYLEDIDFLKYFYSSINLIKENKIIVPKGFYLYELIYPQTVHAFPILNKFNYYFVKLFINNKWYLVFVELSLPYNNKNEIISCYSLNQNEQWCYIIMKALYKCFQILYFSNYQFYIIEMLSGRKHIKTYFNINKIIHNYKKNYIQCILLSEHSKNNNLNNSNNDTSSKEDIKNKNCKKKNYNYNKENLNSFYFLICSYEKEYLRIKCENIKPYNFINFADNLMNNKKCDIEKGYKYINNQGNIRISNAELIPIPNLSNQNNADDISDTTRSISCENKKDDDTNNKIIHSRKYNITINENIQTILQLFKEIITSEQKNSKYIKNDKDCDKNSKNINFKQNKKNNKDICKWLNENDIEKILEKVNINYSSDYLIKIDNFFLKKKKILYFIDKNKFSTLSVSEFIKNKTSRNDSIHRNNKGDKIKKKNVTSSNNFMHLNSCPYLILICSISIKSNKKEIKETSDCEENYLHRAYKSNECDKNISILNEKNKIRSNKYKINGEYNDFCEFYLSFFPYKKKKKKKREKKKKLKKKMLICFKGEKIKEKLSAIKLKNKKKKKRKKKKIIFAKDIFECECFFKQICENEYKSNGNYFFYFNNFIYDLLNNKYKNHIFSNKISKKSILLKENREHFFFLYVKNYFFNNFSIEWINEKNNEKKLINCAFMTIEDFLQKKVKMDISFLKKNIVLKNETLNKVLLKFTINLSLEKYANTFFYLIYKINNLKVLPYLYLYICNIEKSNTNYEADIDEKKKKSYKNIKNNVENFNIIGKFYKFSFEELFLKISIPDNKRECNYLILIVSKKLENINEKNLNLEIAVALFPNNKIDINEENVEKTKNYIKINELLSFYKNYTFNSNIINENGIININDNSLNELSTELKKNNNEENNNYEIKEESICINKKCSTDKNTKEIVNDIKFKNKLCKNIIKKDDEDQFRRHLLNNNNNSFKIIKKIVINSKNNFIYGSIFVKLKNYHLFKNMKVKIIKVKKNKINDEEYADLDFILKKWERKTILKKIKAKSAFFKHMKLLTNESYFIYIEIKRDINLEDLKRNHNNVNLSKNHNFCLKSLNSKMNNFSDIILSIFLNFSDEISLVSDTSNEELEKEMKKYLEFNKINIEEVKKSFLDKRIDNIFDLKNDLLLNFKKDYKNIFISLLHEKEQKMTSKDKCNSNTLNNSYDDGNYDNNYINNNSYGNNENNNQINKKLNETNKEYDYDNKNDGKNNNINDNKYNFLHNINSKQFTNDEEKTLCKEDFYNILSHTLNFDKESFDYLFLKYFGENNNKINMNKFIEIFESLQKEHNYLKLEKFENFEKYPITLFPDDKFNNENEEKSSKVNNSVVKDFNLSFENLFSYPDINQKIIDDTIYDFNLKNNIDILKMKMDAELQLSEKSISLLNNTNNFTDIIKNNYFFLEKIKKKKENANLKSGVKNIINDNNKKINASSKKEGINFNSRNANILEKEEELNLCKSVEIESSITNVQDLINIVKKNDKSLELCDIKNIKMNISKTMKERKLFIESIKNSIKVKKFKNLTSQELKDLYKKALELNLEIYNSDLIAIIKNQYFALDILNNIKCLFKHNELKKKNTSNEINTEEILTDRNLFLELFQKYSNIIKNHEIQLNDYYKNIFKDSQQIFNKIMDNSTLKCANG
ncbi:conserved Plasmodium protein, unknown function [Plasmodium relictum]|uniref:Uncharacterized protein n=1 Tax=Plasmodium relictum TaxID=85471 RepID=A0A1J1HCQ7_PLARL|nr:conserved Plasmodium protein, unknown function [Plasmodium relictum]CRH01204.1 conserved Plasmodium protein, unknown function [Plasmodium relictum]